MICDIKWSVVCMVLCIVCVESSPYPCQWEVDGHRFDLSPLTLSGSDYTYSDTTQGYFYRVNICGLVQVDSNTACIDKLGNWCLYNAGTGGLISVAAKEVSLGPTWSLLDVNDPSKGARLQYDNGDVVGKITPRVIIDFPCQDTTGEFKVVKFDVNSVIFSGVLPSPSGCPSKLATTLSGGWIFIIIFLVSLTIYIAAGCVFKHKKQGTHGMESCPNIDFWRELPKLVKDGCIFTYVQVAACIDGSSSTKGQYKTVG